MIKIKINKSDDKVILAMCDIELIGKKLSNKGGVTLDLERYSSFYDGEEYGEEDEGIFDLVKSANSINAVGKRCLKMLKKLGFDTKSAIKFGGQPHIQIYKL